MDVLKYSAQLYGGPYDGENRVVTPRDLKYGSISLLYTCRHPSGHTHRRVDSYVFDGRNAHGQHRLIYRP